MNILLMRQRSPGVDPTLDWVLEPLSVEKFLDDIWAKDHHHIRRNRPDHFEALLPVTVDTLLESFRHEPSAVRMARGKDKKGPDSYRLADGSLDLDGIRSDFAAGYTIVLDGVEKYLRPVGTLARSIEVALHYPTQVNAYVTPPQSTGLVPHYDDHDVLILQIQGSRPGICMSAPICRRARSNATRTKRLSLRACLRQPTCDWTPATCYMCRAVGCTRPKRMPSRRPSDRRNPRAHRAHARRSGRCTRRVSATIA